MRIVKRAKYSGFFEGVSAAFSIAGLVMFAGFLGFGALVHAANIPVEFGVMMSLVIWALPAQILLISLFVQHASMFTIILAVSMTSIRLIPMVMSVMVPAQNKRIKPFFNYLAIHFIAATVWVLAHDRYPNVKPKRRLAFVIGLGLSFMLIMGVTTYLGYFFAMTMNQMVSMGLVFLMPSFFLTSLFIPVKSVRHLLPIILPMVFTLLVAQYNRELDIIVGGFMGGVLAYILDVVLRNMGWFKSDNV